MSSSITTTTPTILPRDARLIALLLAANGAEDSEEGVVRMLVEFAHRKLNVLSINNSTNQ